MCGQSSGKICILIKPKLHKEKNFFETVIICFFHAKYASETRKYFEKNI